MICGMPVGKGVIFCNISVYGSTIFRTVLTGGHNQLKNTPAKLLYYFYSYTKGTLKSIPWK